MLVLARKRGEQIMIGDHTVLTVLSIEGNTVRLGIAAPTSLRVLRGELLLKMGATPCNQERSLDNIGLAQTQKRRIG